MQRALTYIITLSVPILLILTNIYLFMTPQYLTFEYGKPGFPQAQRFDDAARRYNATESIEYIRGNRTLEQFKALAVYDDREIKHMVDVRELVTKVNVFYALDVALVVIALIALARQKETRGLAARALLNGAILSGVLFIAIGMFAAIGFQMFFTLFHRVFFEGDTWLFNYTDSLIQFYPTAFWFDTSLYLAVLTIGEAIIIGVIGWQWQKREARQIA